MQFKNLNVGDMFNTKAGRYVKTDDYEAIVVMSSMHKLGEIITFNHDLDVIPLYTKKDHNDVSSR